MANEYKSIYTGQEVDEAVAIAQKAVTTDNVVQTTGPSQTNIMSQAAVTAAIQNIQTSGTTVIVNGIQQTTWDADTKINVFQGTQNAGKSLIVGDNGNVVLAVPSNGKTTVNIDGIPQDTINFDSDPQTQFNNILEELETQSSSIDTLTTDITELENELNGTNSDITNILNNTLKISNSFGGFHGGGEGSGTGTLTSGGSLGAFASTTSGGAIGENAQSNTGGAVGNYSTSTTGFSGGNDSHTSTGGAVGYNSYSSDGFSGGTNAKAFASGSIQLGEGTNNTENSLQIGNDNIYNYETHTLSVVNAEINGSTALTTNTGVLSNQGTENAGKVLTVGEDGNVTPQVSSGSGSTLTFKNYSSWSDLITDLKSLFGSGTANILTLYIGDATTSTETTLYGTSTNLTSGTITGSSLNYSLFRQMGSVGYKLSFFRSGVFEFFASYCDTGNNLITDALIINTSGAGSLSIYRTITSCLTSNSGESTFYTGKFSYNLDSLSVPLSLRVEYLQS